MKRKLLFLLMIFAFSWAQAQFQAITDIAFEDELIRLGHDSNPTRDGLISIADAQAVTFLNLTGDPVYNANQSEIGLNITDLTGIKAFSNLTALWVQGNNLTELDLEGMATLIDLRAFFNNLETININGLINLEILGLNVNNLTGINVSTNTSLTIFDAAQNNLLNLDITGLNALTSMDMRVNPLLTCIQVQDATTATSLNNNSAFQKNVSTVFSDNCNIVFDVQVGVSAAQEIDNNGFHVIRSANDPIVLEFNAVDANGQDLNATLLSDYDLTITTLPDPNRNPAAGGDTSVTGIDFELLNGLNQNVVVQNGLIDFSRPIQMQGDQAFEADEYFIIQVTSNDPDINLSNNSNGVVTFPVRIIDNEQTDVNLEILENGIEGSQNVKLRITSSLQNDTGTAMPFEITLQNGLATEGVDFQLANTTIQLPNGQSSVDVDIIVNTDTDATEGTEDFTASVSYTGNIESNRVNIVNGVVTPTIADDTNNGVFNVSASFGGDVQEVSGTLCCPIYEITEGELLEISFDAEANAMLGEEYIVQVSFANGEATEADVSVRENSPNFQYAYSVKTATPDNILQIDIIDDMISEANGENLRITLLPVGSNYNLIGTTVFDVIIIDKPAIITPGISISKTTVTTSEPNINDSFTVMLNTQPTNNVVLNIFSNNVTEAIVATNTLTFTNTNWDQPQTITVTGQDDTDIDGTENYVLTLSVNDAESDDAYDTIADLTINGNNNDDDTELNPEYDGSEGIINFATELKGDIQGSLGSYSIDEGGSLEIWIDAENLPNVDGFKFEYSLKVTTQSTNDYTLITGNENSSSNMIVNENEIDEKLAIQINIDGVDPGEVIIISLTALSYGLNWIEGYDPIEFDGADYNTQLDYTISINDKIPNDINAIARVTNTGGTEGQKDENGNPLPDVFTLELSNLDGTPYSVSQEIIFPVMITPAETDPAETNDYIVRQPLEFRIAPNSSTGTLIIELPDETEANTEHEFYVVTVMASTNFTNISLPDPLIAKIIDDEGTFIVYYTIDDSKLNLADGPGAGCCAHNTVEAGESIRFSFDAEKGAIINEVYKIAIEYEPGNHPENITTYAEEGENKDFYNTAMHEDAFDDNDNEIEIITSVVGDQTPDYNLSIKINSDNDLDLEKFAIKLNAFSDNFRLVSSNFDYPDFLIVPTVEASITAEDDIASESTVDSAEFIVNLDIESPLGYPISIYYELDASSSADEDDFESLPGVLVIPGDKTFGSIIIIPKNDEDVENKESVIIRLIDESGYSIKDSGVASIDIISEDVAPVTATIEATDNEALEAELSNTGEFTFSLNTPNTQADTKIDFEILTGATTDAQNSDYILLDENQQPLGDNRFVTIKSGDDTAKIYLQAINEGESEIDEKVRIEIVSGVGYNVGSPKQAFVEIISATFNEDLFITNSIKVTAQSAICASKDEGGILVENSSGFMFSVSVKKEDDEDFNKEAILEGNKNVSFEELTTGTYFVSLENLTNPELFVPSFTVKLNKLEAITGSTESVNLRTKTGTFVISGSTNYTLVNGSKQYQYNFESISAKTITIPLENGMNSISIQGEANCQGEVHHHLFIDKSYIYPNPTEDFINVLGLKKGEKLNIQISDVSGRIVFQEVRTHQYETLTINLLKFQAGLYFGKITSKDSPTIYFKVLKENK